MDQTLSCNPISVLVTVIPDTSNMFRIETLLFLSLAIPDMFGRCRTEIINPLLVILRFSSSISFMPYISTNKLLYERAIKSTIWQNKILFN